MNTVSLQGGGVFMEVSCKLNSSNAVAHADNKNKGRKLELPAGWLPTAESLGTVSKSSSQNNIKTKQNKKVAIQR